MKVPKTEPNPNKAPPLSATWGRTKTNKQSKTNQPKEFCILLEQALFSLSNGKQQLLGFGNHVSKVPPMLC